MRSTAAPPARTCAPSTGRRSKRSPATWWIMGRYSFATEPRARRASTSVAASTWPRRARGGASASAGTCGRRFVAAMLACVSLMLAGCARVYLDNSPVVKGGAMAVPVASAQARATGSLWRDDANGNFLFADVKARALGDLLTIVVLEDATGSK